jgi:hypothetical protein
VWYALFVVGTLVHVVVSRHVNGAAVLAVMFEACVVRHCLMARVVRAFVGRLAWCTLLVEQQA